MGAPLLLQPIAFKRPAYFKGYWLNEPIWASSLDTARGKNAKLPNSYKQSAKSRPS